MAEGAVGAAAEAWKSCADIRGDHVAIAEGYPYAADDFSADPTQDTPWETEIGGTVALGIGLGCDVVPPFPLQKN